MEHRVTEQQTISEFTTMQLPIGTLFIVLTLFELKRALYINPRATRGRPSDLETSMLYIDPHNTLGHHNSTAGDHPDPSDWQCHATTRWRDLGDSYYPRFVKETVCSTRSCFYGFYSCRPDYYQLHVLTTRQQEHSSSEMSLPWQLRSGWMFDTVDISVSCSCGH